MPYLFVQLSLGKGGNNDLGDNHNSRKAYQGRFPR